jgi:hypothetical protein
MGFATFKVLYTTTENVWDAAGEILLFTCLDEPINKINFDGRYNVLMVLMEDLYI